MLAGPSGRGMEGRSPAAARPSMRTTILPRPPEHNTSLSRLVHSPFDGLRTTLQTYYVSFGVAASLFITYESLIVALTSVATVLFYVYHKPLETSVSTAGSGEEEQVRQQFTANLSLAFISFVIVFPITSNIGFAFTRREKALAAVAELKSLIACIYAAHRDWAFSPFDAGAKEGRRIIRATPLDPARKRSGKGDYNEEELGDFASEAHTDEVRAILVCMSRCMRDYLSLPLVNRSVHLFTASGRRKRDIVVPAQMRLLDALRQHFCRLSLAVERVKVAGMPGNEAARINQYHMFLQREWEVCRAIKSYRTPAGLRAFARLYILLHNLFIGPYYAYVAGAGKEEAGEGGAWPFHTSTVFACSLAVFTNLAMVGLFNVQIGLEDPFDETYEGLDDVRVGEVFRELEEDVLSRVFQEGAWREAVMNGGSLLDAKVEPVARVEAVVKISEVQVEVQRIMRSFHPRKHRIGSSSDE